METKAPEATADFFSLSSGILDGIDRYVLTGNGCEALRLQLVDLKRTLRPGLTPEEALLAEKSVLQVLAEYRALSQQNSTTQVVEMQHIFAMLNQALIAMAEGSDSSVQRLNKIQKSLSRVSLIQDMVALKASLTETVRYVKEESTRAHEATAQELGKFGTEVEKAREFIGSSRIELAGRPEAIDRLSESLGHLVSGQALYLVVYSCDRLQAVTQRYGQEVADELLFRLIKERIQPVAPPGATYRWTTSSLVAMFSQLRDLAGVRVQVANLNRTPVVHRITLGNRTAVLTLTPSHLVAEGLPDGSAPLIQEVDRFTGIRP